MKTVGRLLILAVLLLGGGLWTIFSYCNGTTSFNFGWPVDNSKLVINLTTIGTAVLVGVPLVALGLIVMAAAFIGSIVVQFLRDKRADDYDEYEESSSKRMITLDE